MLVSEETKEKRRSICELCPEKRGHFKLFGITLFKRNSQCTICKCLISLKTTFKGSKCPKGKW